MSTVLARRVARSVRARWRAVRHRLDGDPVPPARLRRKVSADFWKVGTDFRGYMIELGGLRPDDSMLTIGCRAARMAIPLTRYVGADGRYEGVDDSAEAIAWSLRVVSKH